MKMLAVTILCILLPCVIFAQVDIHDKEDGVTVVKSDPDAGSDEIYTSTHQLQQFFEEEKKYVNDIRIISEKKMLSKGSISNLGAYLASYDDVVGDQDEDETFMHNPINVYNLIRHVAVGWPIIVQVLDHEKSQFKEGQVFPKRVRHLKVRAKKHKIPSGDDLDGIAVGIARLHDYYKFNLTSFANEGVLETDQWRAESNGDLTVWDAFKIGVKGSNNMLLGSGIEIMLHALEKSKLEGVTVPPFIESLDQKVLKNLIKTAKTVHDQKLDRWGPRTATHSVNPVPYDRRLGRKKKFANPKPKPNVTLDNIKLWDTAAEKEQYIRLCKGEDLRPQKVQDKLYCKYEHRNIPYYRYGPRKIEIASLKPYIAVMHNFITNSESSEMITKAAPKLKRSFMVTAKNANSTMGDDHRVSEQTWLNEDMSQAAKRITARLDLFLDVEATSTKHSELYQVANYGLAGQYGVHTDAVYIAGDAVAKRQMREVWNIHAGDRAATVMGYLSDVLAGGYTVFPLIGAYVKPRKGSVVVWWNMDKAGGYDWRLRHGGCPVMVGSKWITNKWVRQNSLMFKRPCPKYSPKELRQYRFTDRYQRGGFITDP